jgi:hypothetical protein
VAQGGREPAAPLVSGRVVHAARTVLPVVTNARWLAVRMAAHERGSPEWREWHRLYVMEAKLSVQLAPRLRLHPRWERTTVRKVPSSPRPWDKPPAA